jgi:hypothetical protein
MIVKLRFIERLSEKPNLAIFPNLAYNKIKYLETLKMWFWGFSTVSEIICKKSNAFELGISCQNHNFTTFTDTMRISHVFRVYKTFHK